jgi:3-isopropylmalate/(R)-2-methylmalate dehydratase small subunit
MQKFDELTGVAAPLPMINVDTDMIIPKQHLKTIKRTGLGKVLFDEMRFTPDGKEIPGFVLNKSAYRKAQILIAGRNFGCGSSREHAPWALLDFGIRCVIAPSFADIFFNNCFNNGILPIALPEDICATLLADAENGANATFTVNLVTQTIVRPDGTTISFDIDPSRKQKLLEGLDAVGETLVAAPAIEKYESTRALSQPWLSNPVQIGAP